MSNTYHHGYKAKDRNGKNDNWYANEPKWWRKMNKHKKRRNAQREALHHVERGDEEVLFPLDTKPWSYYW